LGKCYCCYQGFKENQQGVHNSGAIGPYIPNSNPAIKLQHKQRLYGVVIHAVNHNKNLVQFDDGKTMERASAILWKKSSGTLLLHDIIEEQVEA
jgi:hypothetical protein